MGEREEGITSEEVGKTRQSHEEHMRQLAVMELSAVGLVQGGGPEQGASTASMTSSSTLAEVEKRKSFADMKLVDFTSGFSNFEGSQGSSEDCNGQSVEETEEDEHWRGEETD